jgi:lambda repressor-like predicted transcriptional regulator
VEKVIKIRMIEKGLRQKDFRTDLNVSAMTICNVIRGSCKSKRIQAHIANRLGSTVAELWPEQFSSVNGISENNTLPPSIDFTPPPQMEV